MNFLRSTRKSKILELTLFITLALKIKEDKFSFTESSKHCSSSFRETKKIIRIQNMQCYIGYRTHYHLLQMLGRKNIEENEYLIIGQEDDLENISKLTDWYF